MKYITRNNKSIYFKENSIYLDTQKIFDTSFDDFDVCGDEKGNLYILCQDNNNSIHMITISGDKISIRCILNSKINDGYNKYFNIEYINGWLNAVYSIKHDDKYLIIHHIINSDINPVVIDTIDKSSKIFLFRDNDDNLYAIYKNLNIGYKKYNWKSKNWDAFSVLTDKEGELYFADAFLTDSFETVLSINKDSDFSIICNNETIIDNIKDSLCPVIVNTKNETNVLFEYQGRILKSTKRDTDSNFSKAKYAYFGSLSRYTLITTLNEDTKKDTTYGFKNSRGIYEPLIADSDKIYKKEEINTTPPEMPENEQNEKSYNELIKLLENKTEFEILSKISERITAIEKLLEEIKNGNQA